MLYTQVVNDSSHLIEKVLSHSSLTRDSKNQVPELGIVGIKDLISPCFLGSH